MVPDNFFYSSIQCAAYELITFLDYPIPTQSFNEIHMVSSSQIHHSKFNSRLFKHFILLYLYILQAIRWQIIPAINSNTCFIRAQRTSHDISCLWYSFTLIHSACSNNQFSIKYWHFTLEAAINNHFFISLNVTFGAMLSDFVLSGLAQLLFTSAGWSMQHTVCF